MILSAVVALLCTTAAYADSSWTVAGHGYRVDDRLPNETIEAFCLLDSDTAMISMAGDDLKIVDIDSGALLQNLGVPQDGYYDDPLNYPNGDTTKDLQLWTSFITKSPTDNSYWIGFTNKNLNNDRIYQVTPDGTWTYRATLSGNYDLKFLGDHILACANAGGIGSTQNKFFVVDTSGNNNHTVLVETGGYSAGIGTSTEDELYYATYSGAIDGSNSLLQFTFTEEDIQAVLDGEAPYSLGDAQTLYTMTPYGGSDTEVDAGGHVLFSGNYSSGYLRLWDPKQPGTSKTLATGLTAIWLSDIETTGDMLNPGDTACITTTNLILDETGFTKITKLLPGDANGDWTVDASDATILAGNWQSTNNVGWAEGDFNGDGTVDASDATILAGNWQASVNTANTVPEPSSLALLAGLAILGLAAACRRKAS